MDFLKFIYVSHAAALIPLSIGGVKSTASVIFFMYHLLWERWAAGQTENNVSCKRKSDVRSGEGGCGGTVSTGSNTLVLQLVQHVSKSLCNCYLYQDELWKHSTGVGCSPCSSPGTSGHWNVWVVARLATLAAPTEILDCGQYWRKSVSLELADLRPLIKCIHSFSAELQSYHDVIIGQVWAGGLRTQKLGNVSCLDLPQSVLWDPGLVT